MKKNSAKEVMGITLTKECTPSQKIYDCGGGSWFIEGDIVEFFNNIDHEVLIAILTRTIKDPSYRPHMEDSKSRCKHERQIRKNRKRNPTGEHYIAHP